MRDKDYEDQRRSKSRPIKSIEEKQIAKGERNTYS